MNNEIINTFYQLKRIFFSILLITLFFPSCSSQDDSKNKIDVDVDTSLCTYNYNSVWTKLYGSSEIEYIDAIAADSEGNIYLAGFYDTSSGTDTLLILKYDSDGNLIQEKKDTAIQRPATGIAVDSDNNIYISYNDTGANGFIVKYSSSLTKLWQRTIKSVQEITISSQFLYATGGYNKIYTAKFLLTANEGTWKQWEIEIDANLFDISKSVYVNDNHIFITGYASVVTLYGKTYDDTNKHFVIKYDQSGNEIWTVFSGSDPLEALPQVIYADADENVYITGTAKSTIDDKDVFLTKYNVSGTRQWTKLKAGDDGSTESEKGWALVVNSAGYPILGGDIGDGNNVNLGTLDSYMGVFDPIDGTEKMYELLGEPSLSGGYPAMDELRALTIDNGGNLYAAGGTSSDTLNGISSPGGGGNSDIFLIKYSCTQ